MPERIMPRFVRWTGLLIFALLAGFAAMPAAAAPKARVVIVLDASGSMWGQVNGTPKIVIARNVIHDMMKGWDRSIDVGLIAYGHRSKGNCKDIQTLVPVGPANPAAIDKAVDALNPKGKTPLTAAVTRAAEELKYTEEAATVILVSDGLETCNADPCAAAAAMEKAGVNFTTHVIGFGLKENEQKQLRCLADKTGGLFLAAKDAPTLKESLGRAVKMAKAEAAKPVPPKIKGIHFKVLYAKGGPQVKSGISWKIYNAQKDIDGNRKQAAYSYDTEPDFKLDPGDYVAVAAVGSASGEMAFTVKAGEGQSNEIVLNAGLASVSAKRTANSGKPIAGGLSWRVYAAKADIEGNRKQVSYSYDSQPLWTLPAGRYRITVARGAASAETMVDIKAGERAETELILNSGVLAASTVLAKGDPAVSSDTSWKVMAAQKDIEGKRKQVTYSYDSQPNWELTAGKYLLRISRGSASAEQMVTITAGQRTEASVVLNAGLLGAKVTNGGSTAWKVYSAEKDINGNRRDITYSYNSSPVWTVPAGKYLVRVSGDGKSAQTMVTVTAGKRSDVTLTKK